MREASCTRNGAWTWAELRERFGTNTGETCFNDVFHFSWSKDIPFEDVWRDWVKNASNFPQVLGVRSRSATDEPLTGTTLSDRPRVPLEAASTFVVGGRPHTLRNAGHDLPSTVTAANGR